MDVCIDQKQSGISLEIVRYFVIAGLTGRAESSRLRKRMIDGRQRMATRDADYAAFQLRGPELAST